MRCLELNEKRNHDMIYDLEFKIRQLKKELIDSKDEVLNKRIKSPEYSIRDKIKLQTENDNGYNSPDYSCYSSHYNSRNLNMSQSNLNESRELYSPNRRSIIRMDSNPSREYVFKKTNEFVTDHNLTEGKKI